MRVLSFIFALLFMGLSFVSAAPSNAATNSSTNSLAQYTNSLNAATNSLKSYKINATTLNCTLNSSDIYTTLSSAVYIIKNITQEIQYISQSDSDSGDLGNAITQLTDALVGLLGAVFYILSELGGDVCHVLEEVLGLLVDAIQDLVDAINSLGSAVAEIVAAVLTVVSAILSLLTSILSSLNVSVDVSA